MAALTLVALPGGGSAATTNTRILSGPSGTIATDSATFAFTSPEDGGFECRLDAGEWLLHLARHLLVPRRRPPQLRGTGAEPSRQRRPDAGVDELPRQKRHPATRDDDRRRSERHDRHRLGDRRLRLQRGGEYLRMPARHRRGICLGNVRFAAALHVAGRRHPRLRSGASDGAGNTDTTPATAGFATDTTAPETTIVSAPGGTIDRAAASFAFAATEPGGFKCRIDSSDPSDWSSCSSPKSYSSLADGHHSFEVRAADALGNIDPTPAVAGFASTPARRSRSPARRSTSKPRRGTCSCSARAKTPTPGWSASSRCRSAA